MSTKNKTLQAGSLLGGLASFLDELKGIDMRPMTVDAVIDDIVYTSSKIPARIGWELLPRVGTLLGSAVGPLLGEGDGVDAEVIMSVCDRAMSDGIMPITIDLLQSMECNRLCGIRDSAGPVSPEFDAHFAGEYVHLIKVLVFAFRHNYLGFSRGSR